MRFFKDDTTKTLFVALGNPKEAIPKEVAPFPSFNKPNTYESLLNWWNIEARDFDYYIKYSKGLPSTAFELLPERKDKMMSENKRNNLKDREKSVIVIGSDTRLVVEGGVVIVTYKNGQTFHLMQNGKATLDVDKELVVTEHTFMKDGQKAYERVEVKLEVLDSIASDSLELKVLDNGKVSFTTTYLI